MFNRKKNEIKRLEAVVAFRVTLCEKLRTERNELSYEVGRLNGQLDSLEKTTQPAYDMNLLMGAILDYRKILARLSLSDPIWERAALRHLFQKYNVKDEIRHPSEIQREQRRLGRG